MSSKWLAVTAKSERHRIQTKKSLFSFVSPETVRETNEIPIIRVYVLVSYLFSIFIFKYTIRLQRKLSTNILRLLLSLLNREYDRKNRFITTEKLAIFTSYLLFSWPFSIETISTRVIHKYKVNGLL